MLFLEHVFTIHDIMIYRKTSLKTNSRIHHILHPRTPTDKLKILLTPYG